jgi:methionine synthase II (cobalamin-independent)
MAESEPRWHAESVGSLLRPPELLEARRQRAAGELGAPEFKRIEDAAVESAIALQESAGLDVVADGELRRESWMSRSGRFLLEYDDQRSGGFDPLRLCRRIASSCSVW